MSEGGERRARIRNRLAAEASPYLLQHAENPVDWFPWGEEALALAKARDVPILLSIGYSACHWCHVMERECFEDEAIARVMNAHFVCVKVDREERPDLDQVYQMVVQLMGRSGGWPLTVFLTPAQRPFFGGTYFPPDDRYGMPGFPRILAAVHEAYTTKRADVDRQAGELSDAIDRVTAAEAREGALLGPDVLSAPAAKLGGRFDDVRGGFGSRPKFPNTMALEVLLRRGAAGADEVARGRVRRALDAMRAGGIYDQLGGGFHRYSTDEKWLVPHFEKMLYDNALLLRLYVDGTRALGERDYAETARETARYLLGEMRDDEGGFYATTDADSEGVEGKFFVWSPGEIRAALGGDEALAGLAMEAYGVTPQGNFERSGSSVLFRHKTAAELAIGRSLPQAAVEADLAKIRRALLLARDRRVKPFRDEKVLASWNGLVIGALAEASGALGDPTLREAAARAFAFVERALMTDGRLMRHVKGGVVKGPGFLDDHAFVASAALDLYEATGEARYVSVARRLADRILSLFWSEEDRTFFFSPADGEKLIVRVKEPYDHAVPSGASVASALLLRVASLVGGPYAAPARTYLEGVAGAALENPFGFGQTLCAIDRLVTGSVDVVLVGRRSDPGTQALARAVFAAYLPNRTLAWLDPDDPSSRDACSALAGGKTASASGPVAYVCRGNTCSLPLGEPGALAAALRG